MEIEEGLALLKNEIQPKKQEISVFLEDALGMVTCSPIYAPIMVPNFSKSAMDGYAVCAREVFGASKDTPIRLSVQGEIMAGEYKEYSHKSMDAVRVMTGAYIPAGYDSVIRQEDTDYGEKEVLIYKGVSEGTNYCQVGEDIKKGQLVIAENTRLEAVHIGVLASLGMDRVLVYEPLKVAIISTGTELAEIGSKLEPGKIYNSISYLLAANVKREGFEVVYRDNCIDDEEMLMKAIKKAAQVADIVITTGGVSVGKKDLLPVVLPKLSAKVLFHGLNIQPGTPTMASVLEGKVILSLSGNPYAALANFEIFFWPLAAMLMHNEAYDNKKGTAVLGSDYPKVSQRRRFIRAREEKGQVTLETSIHASSVLYNLTQCNCFIDCKENTPMKKGEVVNIQYIKS